MKKVFSIFGAVIIASAILTSCGGGSPEKDGKSAAEEACKLIKDAKTPEEKLKAATDGNNKGAELLKKYTKEEDQKKFQEGWNSVYKDCAK